MTTNKTKAELQRTFTRRRCAVKTWRQKHSLRNRSDAKLPQGKAALKQAATALLQADVAWQKMVAVAIRQQEDRALKNLAKHMTLNRRYDTICLGRQR